MLRGARPGAQRHGWEKLSYEDQVDFDRLVVVRGTHGAARELGISATLIDRLFGGGAAEEKAISRVRSGLEQLRTRA